MSKCSDCPYGPKDALSDICDGCQSDSGISLGT